MITKAQFDQDLKALLVEDKNPFNAWVMPPGGVQPCHPLDASVLILGINNTVDFPEGKSFETYWDPESGYNQPLRDQDLGKRSSTKRRMRRLIPEGVGVVKTNVYEKNSASVKELTAAHKVVREKTIRWILEHCPAIKLVVTLGGPPKKVYKKLPRYPGFPPVIDVDHPAAWGVEKETWDMWEAKIADALK
jgi:hypothetical protein